MSDSVQSYIQDIAANVLNQTTKFPPIKKADVMEDGHGVDHGVEHDVEGIASPPIEDITNDTSSLKPNTGNPYFGIECPQPPEGVDPKKICVFCNKTFSHPGSLGRHLDQKKGSDGHPLSVINQIRSNVRRVGDIEGIKMRRKERMKRYLSQEKVKERTKERRKLDYTKQRARQLAKEQFYGQLGEPSLQPHPTFARLVLFYLPPSQWPHDPPTLETERKLESILTGSDLTKLHIASDNWLNLTQQAKQEIWAREQRRAAEDALGTLSLYQLANRQLALKQKMEEIYSSMQETALETNNIDTNLYYDE